MITQLWLPMASGVLLATGQLFMKRLAISLPADGIIAVAFAALTSPHLYSFVFLNVGATVTYIWSLRSLSMTMTFAFVYVAMGATVLCLDIFVNKTSLSLTNLAGVGLAVAGILMVAAR